jgi:hypothetical protein
VQGPRREGFNLEASVRIDADDDLGRERLCRYGARPPISLDRLRALPGGRLAYRVKTVGRGRAKTRVMTPLELLARLSALVPPPRYPLVRYHGVLAPRSSWRREIVPKPREGGADAGACRSERPAERHHARGTSPSPRSPGRAEPPASPAQARAHPVGGAAVLPSKPLTGVTPAGEGLALTPNVVSVRHWDRLLGGLLKSATHLTCGHARAEGGSAVHLVSS